MEKTNPSSSGGRKNYQKVTRCQNFDSCSDCSDHHFNIKNNSSKDKCVFNKSHPVYKKIMHEWKTLEKDLPESIYVRVYEERIDLLRAAIVGASETPYHGGLFFFDVLFPSNYPNEPPKVYYHSHGLKLNPNLYENGLVCLSLLNTFQVDKDDGKWKPDESNILQILLSVQALVLNENPYWNAAGLDTPENRESRDEEKNSVQYSETAFILSCKTMIHSIRNPPKNFESLVFEHFRQRRDFILGAFEAYRGGLVAVGHYRNDSGRCISVIDLTKELDKVAKMNEPDKVAEVCPPNVSDTFKTESEVVYRDLTMELNKVAKMKTVNELKANIASPSKLKIASPSKLKIAGKKNRNY